MHPQDDDRDVLQSHCCDPFPEPRTIPAGWDTSTLLSAPKPDSVQQTKESTKNEADQPR